MPGNAAVLERPTARIEINDLNHMKYPDCFCGPLPASKRTRPWQSISSRKHRRSYVPSI